MHPIESIIKKYKEGEHIGIFSNCSANEYVLRAVMRRCKRAGMPALIEATANQVNQEGGYTGQTPEKFYAWCHELARREGFDTADLILGGDHLGPLTWSKLSEIDAMENAETLVSEYVLAGFTKIHIDTSMRLGSDDKSTALSNEVIAERGVRLCAVAERAFSDRKKLVSDAVAPIYVVGSEVPIPGGAQEHETLSVTDKDDCVSTISAFSQAFDSAGLQDAWERVVAVVVQPGVEFGEDDVDVYDSDRAKELCSVLKDSRFIFEGHSTDYQPRPSLHALVRDGVVILKVGPALTFALREALFALENIEKIALAGKSAALSRFSEVLETAMLEKPGNWSSHYHGDEHKLKINRAFGFSDRARYYLPEPAVNESIKTLVSNLCKPIPLPLLSQFLPLQYARVRDGEINNTVEDIILDKIGDCVDDYIFAVQ